MLKTLLISQRGHLNKGNHKTYCNDVFKFGNTGYFEILNFVAIWNMENVYLWIKLYKHTSKPCYSLNIVKSDIVFFFFVFHQCLEVA